MNFIKQHLIALLLGAVLGTLGTLLIGIYSDLAPTLLPVLQAVPIQTYIRIIGFLVLLLAAIIALAFALYRRGSAFRPQTLSGRKFGLKWRVVIDYQQARRHRAIEIHWLCPKHKVYLGAKNAEVPDCSYYTLYCMKCDRLYEMKSRGDVIYLSEVNDLVQHEILTKIRVTLKEQLKR